MSRRSVPLPTPRLTGIYGGSYGLSSYVEFTQILWRREFGRCRIEGLRLCKVLNRRLTYVKISRIGRRIPTCNAFFLCHRCDHACWGARLSQSAAVSSKSFIAITKWQKMSLHNGNVAQPPVSLIRNYNLLFWFTESSSETHGVTLNENTRYFVDGPGIM